MSDLTGRLAKMSAIKLALAANEAYTRSEVVNAEPVAIIGAGCRFPGNADSPALFWELLKEGRNAIDEVPRDRWDVDAFYDPAPHVPGKMVCRSGGFVDHLQDFDADFFGISPREAISLDPQQRTLLEVVWETLENGGVPPDTLAGSNTGVFVGISGIDYFMHMQACNYEIDPYVGTGSALSVASGRISYLFGLQGPSLSVDTACSSSLVAVHLACQNLRNRECNLALAGGTHRILLPWGSIGLSQARLLAPDGRCKTFDARADGYVRGEGCGLVLLKRFSDAIADGDSILALIRGSAVNQDGKTSGLTVPNGPAQQAVIRKALRNAVVEVNQVGYLEAHGTGTPLGDPIEVTALTGVFGQKQLRPEPLIIGSVKTNFGHLEAAAGIAGLLKVVLALQHGWIPPHLNFHSPNPHIPWHNIPIKVAAEGMPWPKIDGRRIGCVSSFSFSGTNAHAVLEETPEAFLRRDDSAPTIGMATSLLTLSGKTPAAMRELAVRYRQYLDQTEEPFADICYTSGAGRSHFPERLAIIADSSASAARCLEDWLTGTGSFSVFEGRRTKAPKVGFYFGESAPERLGTVCRLYDGQPALHETLEEADKTWLLHSKQPLYELLSNGDGGSASGGQEHGWHEVAYFALQVALARVWGRMGIEPSVLAGRERGLFAAACVAGTLTLQAGLEILLEWGRRAPDWKSKVHSVLLRNTLSKPQVTLLSVAGKRINEDVRQLNFWIECLDQSGQRPTAAPSEKHTCDTLLGIGVGRRAAGETRDLPLTGKIYLPTLPDDESDSRLIAANMAAMYAAGAAFQWKAVYAAHARRRVILPTYPFQRQRYWVDGAQPVPTMPGVSSMETRASGPRRDLHRETLMRASIQERRALLKNYVTGQLADILKRPEGLVDEQEPLLLLGVDSLMAAELKYRIESDLAIHLEIQSVNEDYSLDNLIDHALSEFDATLSQGFQPQKITALRNNEGRIVGSLLTAHEDGGRTPLYFIHPGGIDISTYKGLAENLRIDQPIYVLQPHGLYANYSGDGEADLETSIEQAASLCVAQLSRLRRHGPYLLAGWSLGALVAYEMARQLKSAGHEVPILFLVDVMCGPARDGSTLLAWFADLLEARTGHGINYSLPDLAGLSPSRQLETVWTMAVAAEAVHASMPLGEFEFLFNRYKDALVASSVRAKGYELNRELCADHVVFLNSSELEKPERRERETVFDWTVGVHDSVEMHTVPGNHYTILFAPAVEALATTMQHCLFKIEGPEDIGPPQTTESAEQDSGSKVADEEARTI